MPTRRTRPRGTVADIANDARRLRETGAKRGHVFASAHAGESAVPLENRLAFLEMLQSQAGFAAGRGSE